jgi:hypothetical protein
MFAHRHCEEPTGPRFGRPDDKLRDEAIQFEARWIASRSLSSGARSRDPLARNDGTDYNFAADLTAAFEASARHCRRSSGSTVARLAFDSRISTIG